MHQLYKPVSMPPSIHKGDMRHLDPIYFEPPDNWRIISRRDLKNQRAFHWPTALGLHLFGGLSVMVCVWMWFYNIHLKLAGFIWQTWCKAACKLVIPKDLEDYFTFRDTFDKDNPVQPVMKQPKLKVASRYPFKKAGVMAALATLSTVFQHGNMFQLQSDLLLRRKLRRYRNCFGGLDTALHWGGRFMCSASQACMMMKTYLLL